MRLLFIRHGEPLFPGDQLTPKGIKEAEILSNRLVNEHIDEIFVSPLHRAQQTARPTLEKLPSVPHKTLDWLREFQPRTYKEYDPEKYGPCWDFLPSDWAEDTDNYGIDTWYKNPGMEKAQAKKEYDWVCSSFDALLKEHGYERNGHIYKADKGNHTTLAFFCHFGLSGVLLSHLLNISPMIFWHNFCAAPSSVTIVNTEERRKGSVSFRLQAYGDTSHLYKAEEEVSFAARFCETYEDKSRHD